MQKYTLRPLKSVTSFLTYPFKMFMQTNSLGGNLLLLALLLGLFLANSQYQQQYHAFWEQHIGFFLSDYKFEKTVIHFINDGLMAVFFFLVGLEIKRELLVGELSVPKKALFPVTAALGGVVFPAIFFALFQFGNTEIMRGWAIPTATDIAFALGILSLLGNKVPISLKIFLTALAIVDDIIAILLIGVFYSAPPNFIALTCAAVLLGLMFFLNHSGIRNISIYLLLAILLWYTILSSGIHATFAGVLAAFTIPVKVNLTRHEAAVKSKKLVTQMTDLSSSSEEILGDKDYQTLLTKMSKLSYQAVTPLEHLEHKLHPLVSYVILPLFAFANSGITIDGSMFLNLLEPLSLGIIFGLCFGKPIGITTICYILSKLKLAEKPTNMSWQQLWASGFFAGIGFTMSILIASLAFDNILLLNQAKLSIIIASALAIIIGTILLLTEKTELHNET